MKQPLKKINKTSIQCPICVSKKNIIIKKWKYYFVNYCLKCDLNFCSEMIHKEKGGDSSPVHSEGIEMMASSFHNTKKIAESFAIKRLNIYEKITERKCNKILDVGCGPGVFYEAYKNLSVNWKGVEINPYWIEFGRNNHVPISKEKLDKINEKFDVITSFQVLEHVERPLEFIKSLKRLLKPGGLIHLELPNNNSLTSRMRKISPIISHDYGFIQPPMHLRAYTKKTLSYLLEKNNLKAVSLFSCSNNNKLWGQVRQYSYTQKLIYTISGAIKMGSLLVTLAKVSND